MLTKGISPGPLSHYSDSVTTILKKHTGGGKENITQLNDHL